MFLDEHYWKSFIETISENLEADWSAELRVGEEPLPLAKQYSVKSYGLEVTDQYKQKNNIK